MIDATGLIEEAWQDVGASFERFCQTTGIATLSSMLELDAAALCGPRHGRDPERIGHRWGRTHGKIGFHGGTVPMDRPRVRSRGGGEVRLPSWEAAQAEDWLGKWAMNLMLINVSTRRFGRAVRLPEGDVPSFKADSRSKSAVSRRFVALSAERMKEWMASDLSELDLLGHSDRRHSHRGRPDAAGCRWHRRRWWEASPRRGRRGDGKYRRGASAARQSD